MKYLLLIALVAVIWWVVKNRSGRPMQRPSKTSAAPEMMVICAHCGVHLPQSDSIVENGLNFCSEAHRQAAKASGKP